jgi:hypothetical protein
VKFAGTVFMVVLVVAWCPGDPAELGGEPADDVVQRIVVGGEVAKDWTLEALHQGVPSSGSCVH